MACNKYSLAFKRSNSTILSGTASVLHEGDTVSLNVVKYGNFYVDKELNTTYTTTIKNARYKFSISLSFPAYFTLTLSYKDSKLNMNHYLIEPGDSLWFERIGSDSIHFSGKGANKLRVQYESRKIQLEWLKKISGWDPQQIKQTFAILDSSSTQEIKYLNDNKKILGDTLFTILFADVLGESGLKIDNFLPYNSPTAVEIWSRALIDYKDAVCEKYNVFNPYNNILKYS